jgi:nucleoside-diphosphate-sugar epimerase
MIVLLTGASGLLGRAVYTALSNNPAIEKVVGTAYSRARDGLVQVLMLLIFDTWRWISQTQMP